MLKLASFAQWSLLHLVSELLYFSTYMLPTGYQNLLVAIFFEGFADLADTSNCAVSVETD